METRSEAISLYSLEVDGAWTRVQGDGIRDGEKGTNLV